MNSYPPPWEQAAGRVVARAVREHRARQRLERIWAEYRRAEEVAAAADKWEHENTELIAASRAKRQRQEQITAVVRARRVNVKAARERLNPKPEQFKAPEPPRRPIHLTLDGRWFDINDVPEALPYRRFLLELLHDCAPLRSVVVERAALGHHRDGNTAVEGDDGTWWARVQLNSDLPRDSHEAERILRHELAHLVHLVALGNDWHTLPAARDSAEAFAKQMERELRPATPPAVLVDVAPVERDEA